MIPWNKNKKKIRCAECGKEKELSPSAVRQYNFCNPKCNGKWQSKNKIISEETRNKLRESSRGRIFTEERKRNISKSLKGKPSIMLGKKHKKSTKEKMRIKATGRRHKNKTKKKLSEMHKGRSWEDRFGIEMANHLKKKLKKSLKDHKGCVHTDVTKKRLSSIQKGKHISPRTEFKKGKDHILWRGGKSFEPYTLDFNERFKEAIRERDNRCCVKCNKLEEEFNVKLSVHHIDYDKKNSFPQNCVSLCRRCHGETNTNRDAWKIFYQKILTERYNYQYTEDQKIIFEFNER